MMEYDPLDNYSFIAHNLELLGPLIIVRVRYH